MNATSALDALGVLLISAAIALGFSLYGLLPVGLAVSGLFVLTVSWFADRIRQGGDRE